MPLSTADEVVGYLASSPALNCIGGEMVASRRTLGVTDPATGEVVAHAPESSVDELDAAVQAARSAQPRWARASFAERRRHLHAFGQRLREHSDELAALTTLEQGRPLRHTRNEVLRAATLLDQLVTLEPGPEVLRSDAQGRVVLHYMPHGVVGAIAPWNVPIGLAVPKVVHALYTGNTIVLKPSPGTPLGTLKLAEFTHDLFPPGVLNVIAGGDALGAALSEHPGIDKLSFTGSIATGAKVMRAASGTLKRLTLELGGNDAAIVLPDADVDAIAQQLFDAALVNSGQVCMAIKRLFVHESQHDALCTRLSQLANAQRLGSGFDPATTLGPVQNQQQFASVLRVLRDTAALPGAVIHAGGKALERSGYFILPTVVSGVREGCELVDGETFGPVLPVLSYHDVDEAITRANASEYGLGASLWTSRPDRVIDLAQRLEAGSVWINRHVGSDAAVPFGGHKRSGLGAQFGMAGLKEHLRESAIYLPAECR